MSRLIDADALMKEALADGAYGYVSAEQIDNAPTIGLSEQAKRDIATIIENEMDMRVVADRKHGKWIGVSPMVDTEECSLCGFQIQSSELETPYCPWCGARMTE